MLGNLVDISSAVGLPDGYVEDCREMAARAGVDARDADALHGWVVGRARMREPIVEWAMAALFRRDAALGAANLESDPFDRYAWELAAEMAGEGREIEGLWTASLGFFESCGATYEVLVHRPSDRCPGIPHLHVRMARLPAIPDVCVGIYEAVYVPFGHRHRDLDHRHREDLADFLESLMFPGEPEPRWWEAEHDWGLACDEDHVGGARRMDFTRMPDYRTLRWPDGEGTAP